MYITVSVHVTGYMVYGTGTNMIYFLHTTVSLPAVGNVESLIGTRCKSLGSNRISLVREVPGMAGDGRRIVLVALACTRWLLRGALLAGERDA